MVAAVRKEKVVAASGLSGPMALNTMPIYMEKDMAWKRNSPKTATAKTKGVWGNITRLSVKRQPTIPLAK